MEGAVLPAPSTPSADVNESKMITQLDPPLPMTTPKGSGVAHFVIDYGPESDLLWVVFMTADGACWAVPNPEIRMTANWSLGRRPQRPNGEAIVDHRGDRK